MSQLLERDAHDVPLCCGTSDATVLVARQEPAAYRAGGAGGDGGAAPFVPWVGGKRRLAAKLLPLFPEHTCYVEPFCGAAALFFMKAPSKVEVLNDVNGELVNLYRVVQHHLDEFVRQFRWALTSRETWQRLHDTPPESLTDVQRAARFFYVQKLAFGAKVDGQNYGTATMAAGRLNLLRIEEELSAAHLRLNRVQIERLDWSECIARYDRPHTLFYMDPPYWQTEGYGVPFGIEQYERLAEALRTMRGKAVVSLGDCPEMRRCFKGLPAKRLAVSYTVSRARQAGAKAAFELVIRNFGGAAKPVY